MATATTSASLAHSFDFGFDSFLTKTYGYRLEERPICPDFQQGHCEHDDDKSCPLSHQLPTRYKNLVCKHWLRGLCKKGEKCEFLHEYNLRQMPECDQWAEYLQCSNGNECLYLHPDPITKLPPCPHYENGFCPLGPHCANRHVKRKNICRYYIAGFCPNGRECAVGAHPKWIEKADLPPLEVKAQVDPANEEQERQRILAKITQRNPKDFGMSGDDGAGGMRSFDRPFRGRGRGGKRFWKPRGK